MLIKRTPWISWWEQHLEQLDSVAWHCLQQSWWERLRNGYRNLWRELRTWELMQVLICVLYYQTCEIAPLGTSKWSVMNGFDKWIGQVLATKIFTVFVGLPSQDDLCLIIINTVEYSSVAKAMLEIIALCCCEKLLLALLNSSLHWKGFWIAILTTMLWGR